MPDQAAPENGAREQLTPTRAVRTALPSPVGQLAALRSAPERPKGTVLLLPGYTGSKEDFAPILDPLAAAGYRAIAVDLPGQFESPGPDEETAYAPLALGIVCAAVIAHLAADGPVVLLGHSFGGLVARGAALAGAPIAGLILLCTGPAALPAGQRLDSVRAGEPIIRAHGKAAVYDSTVAVGRADRRVVPPDVEELSGAGFSHRPRPACWAWARLYRTNPTGWTGCDECSRPAGPPLRSSPDGPTTPGRSSSNATWHCGWAPMC